MNQIDNDDYKTIMRKLSFEDMLRIEIERSVNDIMVQLHQRVPEDVMNLHEQDQLVIQSFTTKYGTVEVQIPKGVFNKNIRFRTGGMTNTPKNQRIVSTSIVQEGTQQLPMNTNVLKTRKLRSRYSVIFCDATHLTVRHRLSNEILHLLIGITEEGYKEVLDYGLFLTECSKNYEQLLKNVQNRGCEQVLMLVGDGYLGLEKSLKSVFPNARFQTCWGNLQRRALRYVQANDRQDVRDMLRLMSQAPDELRASKLLEEFVSTYEDQYPKVAKMLENEASLFGYLAFPKAVQRSIYSNNVMDFLFRTLRRNLKHEKVSADHEGIDLFIYQYLTSFDQRYSNRIHKGFDLGQMQIDQLFQNQS